MQEREGKKKEEEDGESNNRLVDFVESPLVDLD